MPADSPLKKPSYVQKLKEQISANSSAQVSSSQSSESNIRPFPTSPRSPSSVISSLRKEVAASESSSTANSSTSSFSSSQSSASNIRPFPTSPAPTATPKTTSPASFSGPKESNVIDFAAARSQKNEVAASESSSTVASSSTSSFSSSQPSVSNIRPFPTSPAPTATPKTTSPTSFSRPKESNIIDFAAAKSQKNTNLTFSLDQLNPKSAVITTAIANGVQKDQLLDLLHGSLKNELLTAAKIQTYDTRAIEKFAEQISQEYDTFYNQLASQYNSQLNDLKFKERAAQTILSQTEIAQLGEEIFQTSQDIIDSSQPQTLIQNYFQKKGAVSSSQSTSIAPTSSVAKNFSQKNSSPEDKENKTEAKPEEKAVTGAQSTNTNFTHDHNHENSSTTTSSASAISSASANQAGSSPVQISPQTQSASSEEPLSSPSTRVQSLRQNISHQEESPTASLNDQSSSSATSVKPNTEIAVVAAPLAAATTLVDAPSTVNQSSSLSTSSSTSSPNPTFSPTAAAQSASSSTTTPPDSSSASISPATPSNNQSTGSAQSSSPKRSFRSLRSPLSRKTPRDRLQKKGKDLAAKTGKKIGQKALQALGKFLTSILPYIWPLLVGLGIGLAGLALATGGVATIAGGGAVVWTAITAWVSSTFSPFDNAAVQLANQAPAADKSCAQCLTITKTSVLEGGLTTTGEAIDANNAKRARFTYTLTPNTEKCTDIKLNGDCSDLISITCKNSNSETCPGVDPITYQIPETLTDITHNSAATNAVPENYRLPENITSGTAEDGNIDLLACNALLRTLKIDNLHNYPLTESVTFNLDEFLPNGYSLPYGDDYRLDNTFTLGYSGQPINTNNSSQTSNNCSTSLTTNALPITPTTSENIIWSAESTTLKSWIIQKSNYKLTRIWLSSPSQQINKYGSLLKEYAINMSNSAINNNNLSGKIFIATDASGFHNETAFGKIIITNGQILRDDQSLDQGVEGKLSRYYTFDGNGTLNFYKNTTSSQDLLNTYCAKNTFAFYPPMIEGGKLAKALYSTGENRMREGFCQIDTNNYALITGTMDLDDVAKIMLSLGCQTGVNFDGGGSTCLYTKDADGIEHIIFGCTSRKIPDILYFNEL